MNDEPAPSDPTPPDPRPLDPASGTPLPESPETVSGATETAAPGVAPVERRVIEPAPRRRRGSALPAICLLGVLALAGALAWLWTHPQTPPELAAQPSQMEQLRQQVGQLEGQLGTAQDVAKRQQALEQRVAGLENRPTPQAPDLKPLQAQVAALSAAVANRPTPAPTDAATKSELAQLSARVDNLAKLSDQMGGLAKLPGRMDALEKSEQSDVAGLSHRLDGIDSHLAQIESHLAQLETHLGQVQSNLTQTEGQAAQAQQATAALSDMQKRATRAARLQAASAALDAGEKLGDIPGAPPALSRFANEAPPTMAQLRLSYPEAAKQAKAASQPDVAGGRLLDRMWARAQAALTVRQGDKVIVGDPASGVLAHAQEQLDAGDLAGAVASLSVLQGPAAQAMSGWLGQARSLLEARAALADMAARA